MPGRLELVHGDITKLVVDAIVNAANTSLLGGGGVDGAIHRAGGPDILADCMKIRAKQGGCPTGEAVITGAGRLRAKHVIHTVGPVWNGGNHDEPALLESCYVNCFELALEHHVRTMAFPCISTGVYDYPKHDAAEIAVRVSREVLAAHPDAFDAISFVCFDHESLDIYEQLLATEAADEPAAKAMLDVTSKAIDATAAAVEATTSSMSPPPRAAKPAQQLSLFGEPPRAGKPDKPTS